MWLRRKLNFTLSNSLAERLRRRNNNGRMEEELYDVVVIGGGISGLRTAMLLKQKGFKVKVLEARDRVGGRTKGDYYEGVQYDVGGQWIGPTQTRMYALCEEFKLETMPQHIGLHMSSLNGKLAQNITEDIPRILPFYQLPLLLILQLQIDRMARKVPVDKPWEAKEAEEWDSQSVEGWLREHCRFKYVRAVMDIIIWALLCTEPSRVSLLWFLWFVSCAGGLDNLIRTRGGAQQDRIKGGAIQIAQKMLQWLGDEVVMMSSPVTEVHQHEEDAICEVRTQNNIRLKAKRVVITCPPIFASRIHYFPPLPPIRDHLTQSYHNGQVIKALIFYPEPFWREKKMCGESTSDRSIRLTFDASYPNHDPPIFGVAAFFLGDAALRWSCHSPHERRNELERHISFMFPKSSSQQQRDIPKSIGYLEGNWVEEEWSRGAYMSVLGPGVLSRCGDAIRCPIGRLHFAGTETAVAWSGYMEGALQSAERVTHELLPLLSKENVHSDVCHSPQFRPLKYSRFQLKDGCFSLFSCKNIVISVAFGSLGYLLWSGKLSVQAKITL